jgi:Zn-dependent peptidase ImmA (M78 family)
MNTIVDLAQARGRAARRRALAFAEISLAVFLAVEQHVRLPRPSLPDLDVPPEPTPLEIAALARQARQRLGVAAGPVPHVVRLLEAHGVAVVRFERHDLEPDGFDPDDGRFDEFTFSHLGHRPIVLLDPADQDKARSRFDAARELGNLLLHRPGGPGRRRASLGPGTSAQAHERATAFATEFLAPTAELAHGLPLGPGLDSRTLHDLKRRWGMNLSELVRRARALGRMTNDECRQALAELHRHGSPEPGSLGPLEEPVLLPRAFELLARPPFPRNGHRNDGVGRPEARVRTGPDLVADLSAEAALPLDVVQHVVRAAGVRHFAADLALERHG